MVRVLQDNPGAVKIGTPRARYRFFEVDATAPYLRSATEMEWMDNLLNLPRY